MKERILIVGAGHAGGSAAVALRHYGWAGGIVMIGAEPELPYQRPPLSKGWLKGEVESDELHLRPSAFYEKNAIDIRLGTNVASIDRGARDVELGDASRLSYDFLILATGARARDLRVAGAELSGVLSLRTVADAARLKAALFARASIAIIGGGYVGLEVAASARALGTEVTIIEREPRCLSRVACGTLSQFFEDYHARRGVTFVLGAGVERLEGEEGRVTGVRLSDGRMVSCSVAIVGIGALPNAELARAAGLACTDGINVDQHARTQDPAIYAIGDVSYRPMPLYDRMLRLESVPNALEQAKQAAAHICGRDPPKPETPWFWSDQYDLKLQIAGVAFEADEIVTRGDPATAHFALFHMRQGRVVAVEAVNAPQEFMVGRLLIGAGLAIDPQRLADSSIPMREVSA